MKLELTSIEENGVVKVATDGRITMGDFPPNQKNPLAEILGADWASKRVLLDLSRSAYIDSAAVGWLLQTQKEFKAKGGKLVVHSIPPTIYQVFELLKINKVLTLARNLSQALELLNGDGDGRSNRPKNAGRKRTERGRRGQRSDPPRGRSSGQ